jgi:hypothetical protein
METARIPWVDKKLREITAAFDEARRSHPLKKPKQCVSLVEAFWVWYMVRKLRPKVIIESGTYEGYSLWFLHKAAPPNAKIFSFDPAVRPSYNIPGVQYVEKDWMEFDEFPDGRKFVFFDDHQDHDMRMEQSIERGVTDALFHDNYLALGASHRPLRFCALPDEVLYCREMPNIALPLEEAQNNAQAFRWITWLRFKG